MKKIIFLILLTFFVFPPLALADDGAQKGADLYLEATTAVAKKDFALAKAKFEEAAAFLSGENQSAALKIADFFGRMSPQITQKKLSLSDQWIALGEVREADRFWQLYQFSTYGASILRLAISGEKPIEEMAAAMGPDLFEKKLVIKNREGYISKPNVSIAGMVLQVRMWYCDKDDTTNIVYATDGYAKDGPQPVDDMVQLILTEFGHSFSNVKCSREFSGWIWIAVVLLGAISLGFYGFSLLKSRHPRIKGVFWKKEEEKGKIIEKPPIDESTEKKGIIRKILSWASHRIIFLSIVTPIIIFLLLLLWILSPAVLR